MKDQMNRPLDRAVYWIEYVMRHHGAPHLRTAARHHSLFQRGLLDVIFIATVSLLLFFYIIYRLIRGIISRRRRLTSQLIRVKKVN